MPCRMCTSNRRERPSPTIDAMPSKRSNHPQQQQQPCPAATAFKRENGVTRASLYVPSLLPNSWRTCRHRIRSIPTFPHPITPGHTRGMHPATTTTTTTATTVRVGPLPPPPTTTTNPTQSSFEGSCPFAIDVRDCPWSIHRWTWPSIEIVVVCPTFLEPTPIEMSCVGLPRVRRRRRRPARLTLLTLRLVVKKQQQPFGGKSCKGIDCTHINLAIPRRATNNGVTLAPST